MSYTPKIDHIEDDGSRVPMTLVPASQSCAARDKAIKYIVRRIIEDPNVHYYCGYGTEVFHLVSLAAAEMQGRSPEEVEAEFRAACDGIGEPDVERLRRELVEVSR